MTKCSPTEHKNHKIKLPYIETVSKLNPHEEALEPRPGRLIFSHLKPLQVKEFSL